MNDKLNEAVTDFVETWDDHALADEIAPKLSCWEVDRLAALLRAARTDNGAAADAWIEAHAAHDKVHDAHYQGPLTTRTNSVLFDLLVHLADSPFATVANFEFEADDYYPRYVAHAQKVIDRLNALGMHGRGGDDK